MAENGPVALAFRPARPEDFEYCRRLYFEEMEWIIEKLHLNRSAQDIGFREQWEATQVRIIAFDGPDVGWVQTIPDGDDLFVAQIFVDTLFQRKGIGTEVMQRLIEEAASAQQNLHLAVAKINPAMRLYERLGFQVTDEDDRKFYMKLDWQP